MVYVGGNALRDLVGSTEITGGRFLASGDLVDDPVNPGAEDDPLLTEILWEIL